MQISALRIRNYKAFRDSEWIHFGPHFTVIVGQNNVGKTALLEAFRLGAAENKPYRGMMLARNAAPFPTSRFDVRLRISGSDLKAIAVRESGPLAWVQIPDDAKTNPQRFINMLFAAPALELEITTTPGAPSRSIRNPSHGLFEKSSNGLMARVAVSENRERVLLTGAAELGEQDNLLPYLLDQGMQSMTYVFRAERLSVGVHPIQDTEFLASNGANLASVLLRMQSNPARWERFNEHVRTIFPAIKRVVIGPLEEKLAIVLWSVDLETERDDLAIRLEESGTGVAQVLAILYVAMSRERNVIVIDEPNSFLHPGAARKLVRILKLYKNNQYVISTHSTDIISTIDPEYVHLVQWDGSESRVRQLDGRALARMNRVLTDFGVDLKDVFGADKVVWVDGQVERKCFPMVADALLGGAPLGWAFVPLHNTRKLDAGAEGLWQASQRLQDDLALAPATAAFSFDPGGRTEREAEEITRLFNGSAHVLPRASYENYLIDPSAIRAVLSQEYASRSLRGVPSVDVVAGWIETYGHRYGCVAGGCSPMNDRHWLANCDAEQLLAELFPAVSNQLVAYSRITHAAALTEWLLSNAPENLAELGRHIEALIQMAA